MTRSKSRVNATPLWEVTWLSHTVSSRYEVQVSSAAVSKVIMAMRR